MKLTSKLAALCCLGAAVLLSGCKSSNLAYFSDVTSAETVTDGSVPVQKSVLKIEPDDELMINVSSRVPEASAIYNLPFNNTAVKADLIQNNVTSQKQTYTVDKQGDINFPILGKIHVGGMTTSELADYLTKRISQDVDDPLVRVELINFNVNVMGEVQQPGQYNFTSERVSVLDALAKAGDMSVFGKRSNVTVWREEDGVVTYHKLNLNDSKIYASPYFYLKQNDVVYVEPSSARAGQADYNQNNSYKVSVISAIVSGASVISSLVIALVLNQK